MFERGRRSIPSTHQQPQLIGSNSEQSEDCRTTRDIFGHPGGNGSPPAKVQRPLPTVTPDPSILGIQRERVFLTDDPQQAVDGADLVVTDTWTSIGMESERAEREAALSDYRVTEDLMKNANTDALFMHCLPAYRGKEVVAAVIDGPQSVVWDEAENRLHAQKAVLLWCMT